MVNVTSTTDIADAATESSTDWNTASVTATVANPTAGQWASTISIVTYVGSAIAIVGVMLTLLSYIGYRKFHVKRPHIITVNLCVCLLVYYFSYMVSNGNRQNLYLHRNPQAHDHLCLFGALMCHFSVLASWLWILSYWLLLLMMYRRPMGGHVSHFFIKSAIPAYTIPLVISITIGVVGYTGSDVQNSMERKWDSGFFSSQCFVANLYLYLGGVLPFFLAFIPMVLIFVIIFRGVINSKDDGTKSSSSSSNSYRKVKHHFKRLTFITALLAIVALSSMFAPTKAESATTPLLAAVIIFSVASSVLGLALMIIFCIHHDEIRSHWLSVARGENTSMRQHSLANRSSVEGGSMSSQRKSSTLLAGNHPSVYIESYDDDRKASTYRIVAKEDTDMSTLGLIQIPGTPSPNRAQDANGESSNDQSVKVRRKKSDVANKAKRVTPKNAGDAEREPLTPDEDGDDRKFEALRDEGESGKSRKKRQARSTSTPPSTPRKEKSTKRQQSVDDVVGSSSTVGRNGASHAHDKKPRPKRSNSGNKLITRFTRKSTSITEDTVQLTDFN